MVEDIRAVISHKIECITLHKIRGSEREIKNEWCE